MAARVVESAFIAIGVLAVLAVVTLATIPEFIWELALGVYLAVKGFRPSPILGREAEEMPIAATPAPAVG